MSIVRTEDIFTANKSWGVEFILKITPMYVMKLVEVSPGKSTRKKSYVDKEETWFIVSGEGSVNLHGIKSKIKSGDTVQISSEIQHFASAGPLGLRMIVVSTPELWEG